MHRCAYLYGSFDGATRGTFVVISLPCYGTARTASAGRAAVLDSSSTKYGVQKYSVVLSKANRSGGTISTKKLRDESGRELGIDGQSQLPDSRDGRVWD